MGYNLATEPMIHLTLRGGLRWTEGTDSPFIMMFCAVVLSKKKKTKNLDYVINNSYRHANNLNVYFFISKSWLHVVLVSVLIYINIYI